MVNFSKSPKPRDISFKLPQPLRTLTIQLNDLNFSFFTKKKSRAAFREIFLSHFDEVIDWLIHLLTLFYFSEGEVDWTFLSYNLKQVSSGSNLICLSTNLICFTQIHSFVFHEEVQHEREVWRLNIERERNFTTKLILWLFNVSKLFDVCSSTSEYGTERCKFEISLFAATTEKPHHMRAIWSYESIVNIPAHVAWLKSDSWGKNVNRRNKNSKCTWWSWLLQSFSCDNSQKLVQINFSLPRQYALPNVLNCSLFNRQQLPTDSFIHVMSYDHGET